MGRDAYGQVSVAVRAVASTGRRDPPPVPADRPPVPDPSRRRRRGPTNGRAASPGRPAEDRVAVEPVAGRAVAGAGSERGRGSLRAEGREGGADRRVRKAGGRVRGSPRAGQSDGRGVGRRGPEGRMPNADRGGPEVGEHADRRGPEGRKPKAVRGGPQLRERADRRVPEGRRAGADRRGRDGRRRRRGRSDRESDPRFGTEGLPAHACGAEASCTAMSEHSLPVRCPHDGRGRLRRRRRSLIDRGPLRRRRRWLADRGPPCRRRRRPLSPPRAPRSARRAAPG